ncbi:MFS transporter [Parahaliea mediterranea]|uniref:MFS transporter n=1 Tax=Parahaliea mediterranea TaxID=651086 RepID=UPI00321A7DBA
MLQHRAAATAAAVLLSFIATGGFLILPLLVGAAATDFQLTEAQVGILATAVMGGAALSSAAALLWIRRVDWRRAVAASMLLILLAHFGCLYATGAEALALLLLLTGLGGGAAYSVALTVLADQAHAARYFGLSVAAQVTFQIVGMLLLPPFIADYGLVAVLALLLALNVAGLCLAWWLPAGGLVTPHLEGGRLLPGVPALLALLGCFLFFFNVGVVWAYIERMASAAGLSPEFIGLGLAIGVSFGIPGALMASWCGDRYGQVPPLVIGGVVMLASVALLAFALSGPGYIVALALYNFSWNFCLAFQYAAVNRVDDNGRSVAVAPAFHGFGAAVGPVVAAIFVTRESYLSVHLLAFAGIVGSVLLFALSVRTGVPHSAAAVQEAA